jgi:uncharacterized membrane protein YhiD involved in acid resistance
MAAGAGAWLLAVLVTLTIWTTLVLVRYIEVHALDTKSSKRGRKGDDAPDEDEREQTTPAGAS